MSISVRSPFHVSRFTFHASRFLRLCGSLALIAGFGLFVFKSSVFGLPGASELSGTYRPPFIPIKLTIESDGTLSLNADTGFVTPIGQFSVGGAYFVPRDAESNLAVSLHQQIASRVDRYFAALNAGDYAQAHRICCTSAWRQRYPLPVFQQNFVRVSNLKNSPPRFLSVERDTVRIETYYNFTSSGQRKAYVLRWTMVREGSEWLAAETSAVPQ